MNGFSNYLSSLSPEKRDFLVKYLPEWLKKSDDFKRLYIVLTCYPFLDAKLSLCGIGSLIEDFNDSGNVELELISESLILSSHILQKDKYQLRQQLVGRLSDIENSGIRKLLDQIKATASYLELLPLTSSLTSPGKDLLLIIDFAAHCIEISPDSKFLLAGGSDIVTLWNIDNGCFIRSFEPKPKIYGTFSTQLESNLGNNITVTRDSAGRIKYIDSKSGDVLWTEASPKLIYSRLAFLPGGKHFLSISENKITLWDIDGGEILYSLPGTLTKKKKVIVRDKQTGEIVNSYKRISNPWIKTLTIAPDGDNVVLGSSSGELVLWTIETGHMLKCIKGHDKSVTSLAFSTEAKMFASGSSDGTIKFWNTETWEIVNMLVVPFSLPISDLAIFGNKYLIAAAGNSQTDKEVTTFTLFDIEFSRVIHTFSGYNKSIVALSKPKGNGIIASASVGFNSTDTVDIWEIYSGNHLKSIKQFRGKPNDVIMTPDCQQIVIASDVITKWRLSHALS
ncbi:MAG: hypothetical protein IPM39_25495 [Chloroflexi bacterium]|nr:hypothetical protein [Chloroflexota bacterium]